jgi:hypothetical protein
MGARPSPMEVDLLAGLRAVPVVSLHAGLRMALHGQRNRGELKKGAIMYAKA